MKSKLILMSLVGSAVLLQGCIALPPLVNVERKEVAGTNNNNNDEVLKRLDAIDKRLGKLEEQK